MMAIPLLILFLVVPVLFRLKGKRLFGDQTHPAALFILTWIACAFLFNMAEVSTMRGGLVALIWVVLCFAVIDAVAWWRKKQGTSDA